MSTEQAKRFLEAVALHEEVRTPFAEATDPEDFADRARGLGYDFTPEELKQVVQAYSQGASRRRPTGIWEWLRTVPWVVRS